MLEGHYIQVTGSIHAGKLAGPALYATAIKRPRMKSQFTSTHYSNMPQCLTNISQEYGEAGRAHNSVLLLQSQPTLREHTMSTFVGQFCTSTTSGQYSNTPVNLTVYAKCMANSGRNISLIITLITGSTFRIRGFAFDKAPYPEWSPVTVISYQDNRDIHHLFDQNKPDVRIMTEGTTFTMTAQFETLPGLATWLPSRTLAAIHQTNTVTRCDVTSQLLPSMRYTFNVGNFNSIQLTRVTSIPLLSTSFWQ